MDCHINHLYNLCYTNMRARSTQPTPSAVEAELSAMDSAAKNEMLWREFAINYNEQPPVYRKGSILLWERYSKDDERRAGEGEQQHAADALAGQQHADEPADAEGEAAAAAADGLAVRSSRARQRRRCVLLHEDLITAPFFVLHPGIIPPLTNTEWKKQLLRDEKQARRKQHRAADALAKQQQATPAAAAVSTPVNKSDTAVT